MVHRFLYKLQSVCTGFIMETPLFHVSSSNRFENSASASVGKYPLFLGHMLFVLLLSVLQVGSPCHNHLPETHEVKSLCVPLTILSYSNFLTLSIAFPPILQLPWFQNEKICFPIKKKKKTAFFERIIFGILWGAGTGGGYIKKEKKSVFAEKTVDCPWQTGEIMV